MKQLQTACLIISLGLNVFLAYSIAKRTSGNIKPLVDTAGLFSITNLNPLAGSEDYVVAYKNGKYWWNIDGDVISMNIGFQQGAILRLDKSTDRIKSTTIELLDTNGTDCYFTDMNADGIPDKKRMGGGDDWQIFYNGKFVPSFMKNNTRYAVINSVEHPVKFDGEKWVASESERVLEK
jgi:hypothetical protein